MGLIPCPAPAPEVTCWLQEKPLVAGAQSIVVIITMVQGVSAAATALSPSSTLTQLMITLNSYEVGTADVTEAQRHSNLSEVTQHINNHCCVPNDNYVPRYL